MNLKGKLITESGDSVHFYLVIENLVILRGMTYPYKS